MLVAVSQCSKKHLDVFFFNPQFKQSRLKTLKNDSNDLMINKKVADYFPAD